MSRRYFGSGSSVRDRTSGFRVAVAAARGSASKASASPDAASASTSAAAAVPLRSARHALLDDPSPSPARASPAPVPGKRRGEFAERAQLIFLDVARTSEKLGNLAQLVQRRNLFDDRAVEISQLTQVIKADLAAINSQITGLQQFASKTGKPKGPKATVAEHQGNVDILETRTQNIKASRDRTGQYAYGGAKPATGLAETSDSPLYRNRRPHATAAAAAHRQLPGYDLGPSSGPVSRASTPGKLANSAALADENASQGRVSSSADGEYLALDMGNNGNSFTQMQLMEQQDDYVQQRSRAIESIEGTISELGQMFGQLAHMVAAQRETVQRIDEDVFAISDNVSGAQNELLRYYASVSSNRALMLKIFGVLIIFFLLFILVS